MSRSRIPFRFTTVRRAVIHTDGHIVTFHGDVSLKGNGKLSDRTWCEITERFVQKGPSRPIELSFGGIGLIPAIAGAASVWLDSSSGRSLVCWLTCDGRQLGSAAEGNGVTAKPGPGASFERNASAKAIDESKVSAVHRAEDVRKQG